MTTSGQSDIDRELSEVYDYVRREGQSGERITIPVALLEEVLDSIPNGDGRVLLFRALTRGGRL